MRKKILFTISLVILLSCKLFSQSQGDSLFKSNVLHEIRIEFKQSNFWDILMENYTLAAPLKSASIPPRNSDKKTLIEHFSKLESDMSKSEIEFLSGNAIIDGNKINNIGVRLKGYSSFFSVEGNKKSLKLDFDAYNDTLNYDGIHKVNINNGVGDPSFQRDFISYNLLSKAGVIVPRVAYAKVYLNNIYWGLYAITEQVDQHFLEKNFASGKGNLFKTVGWNELAYTNNNFKTYSETIELKTNEKTADGSDYIRFVKSLNKLNGKAFADSIQKLFYVDYYFKVLAIDIISKNWDSYISHGRNFYLYHEPVSDLFYWIPWDYNLAWDGMFGWDIPEPANCNQTISITYDTIDTKVNCSFELPRKDLEFVSLNYGDNYFRDWNGNFGKDSITTLTDTHIFDQKGIYNIQVNASYNNGCYKEKKEKLFLMDTSKIECKSLFYLNRPYFENDTLFNNTFKKDKFCCNCQWDNYCELLYYNPSDTLINDPTYAIDFITSKTLINKLLDNDEYKSRYLDIFKFILDSVFIVDELTQMVYDNTNLIRDAVAADTNYLFSINEFENDIDAICREQFQITSFTRLIQKRKVGLEKEFEYLGYDAQPLEKSLTFNDIVINEFVANASDNNYDGTDWIELYNNTRNIVPLSDIWLSDEINNPKKFNIPKNTVIKPDGFVIIWADNENKKNGLHANFKLSADGEGLILFHNLYDTLDVITFEAQFEDSAFARFPNGVGSFKRMAPTLNSHNIIKTEVGVDDNLLGANIVLYPNPAHTSLFIKSLRNSDEMAVTLYNSLGSKIILKNAYGNTQIDVSNLSNGIYAITVEQGERIYQSKIIIMH